MVETKEMKKEWKRKDGEIKIYSYQINKQKMGHKVAGISLMEKNETKYKNKNKNEETDENSHIMVETGSEGT